MANKTYFSGMEFKTTTDAIIYLIENNKTSKEIKSKIPNVTPQQIYLAKRKIKICKNIFNCLQFVRQINNQVSNVVFCKISNAVWDEQFYKLRDEVWQIDNQLKNQITLKFWNKLKRNKICDQIIESIESI
jgi:hypothetical protein